MKMRNIVAIFLFFTSPILLAQSVFDKFENHESVSYMSFSPRLFQMMASMNIDNNDPEAQEFFELVNNINSFKLLRTDDQQISKEFIVWVDKQAKSNNLEELMRVRDGGSKVNFYIKSAKDSERVEELMMLVSDAEIPDVNIDIKPQTVLLVIKGDIDLERISALTKKMDIPGSDELNKLNDHENNK